MLTTAKQLIEQDPGLVIPMMIVAMIFMIGMLFFMIVLPIWWLLSLIGLVNSPITTIGRAFTKFKWWWSDHWITIVCILFFIVVVIISLVGLIFATSLQ